MITVDCYGDGEMAELIGGKGRLKKGEIDPHFLCDKFDLFLLRFRFPIFHELL